MADCRCVQVFMFCVFTQIFLLCVAQNTHMKNVAENKPCGQSSEYGTYHNCSAALNGNTNTDFNENTPNCIHTGEKDKSPFWWVDLGEKVTIIMITIYGRKDFISRMPCVNVSVDGALVKRFTDVSGWTNDVFNITVLRGGRVVNITKDCDKIGPTINICEVQVWVCDDGWYDDCSKSCGQCDNNTSCDKVNGNCPSCQTGFNPPLCQECADGYYGTNCSQTCGKCASNSVCNKTTGRCTSCQTGFNPPFCKECVDGRYGTDCSQTCGNCITSSDCDKATGRCTSCKTGFRLPYCTDCENGWHGHNCNETCGHCIGGNTTCDKINGSCSSCEGAFKPPLCKDNCEQGWYGDNCVETCGHCKGGNSTCDKINGSCPSCDGAFKPPLCKDNCEEGWYGDNCNQTCGHCMGRNSSCDKINGSCPSCIGAFQPPLCKDYCENGWYGHNCAETCGHCMGGNSSCDKINGSCLSCEGAFKPPLCKYKCEAGHYGENCSQLCGHCRQDTTCDPDNGTCLDGCSLGFKPGLCTECDARFYGENCDQTCGHCHDNTTCDPVNGTCPSGCSDGYRGSLCKEAMTSSSTEVPVGAIVGPVLAVIVAAVVVVIVFMWLRRRQREGKLSGLLRWKKESPQNEVTLTETMTNVSERKGNKPIVPVKPQTHTKTGERQEVNDPHIYGNLREDTPTNSQLTSPMTSENTDSEDQVAGTRKPLAMKAENRKIYENVDLKTSLPTKPEDIQPAKTSTKPNKEEREVKDPTDEEEGNIYNTEDIYASYRSLGPSSILDDLQKSLLASLASGKLGMEFADFRKDMHHPHEIGLKSENRNKNRFKALCAYDHSRVALRRPKGDTNTDYINASYIKGCIREKAYIATQGPRSNTVDDLWWMVWQENATQIVMLTNLIEGGKDKCEEYWPSVGTTKTYGHVTVTALKTDTRADFVVRYFVVQSKKGGDQRTVSQYHYLVWPDHGVPSTYSLVSFWRYVKARAQGAIPVVHCSAGVGRTGTYIALDIAADLRSRGRDVNVKDIVSGLREDRTLMVQTEEQYKFLHEVILEEHTSHGTRMTFDQFDIVFPSNIDAHNSRINMEFKLLEELGRFVPKPRHQIAESEENRLKNRNKESLPDDSHLVYLMDRVPGRNQYINAIHMSSFRKVQGLILTQLPLPDTVVDMWRLVDGWDVNTIVSLGHRNQSTSVKNYCHYWPETEKEVLKTGQHTIKLTSTSALGDHLTCYNLSLMTKMSTPREVRVLYYDDWSGVVPGNSSDILHLMDTLESWHIEENTSPVVVQCSDGMTRSGMFCALYEVINGARHDQEIDVYLSVRHVQSVRPKAVTTEAQYRYCYQVAQEYKRQESIYQNT